MEIHDLSLDYLPYCLQRQEDGSHVPLNRDMKPVAFRPGQFGLMGDAAGFVRFEGITPSLAAKISCRNDDSLDCIFMYDDEQAPAGNSQHVEDYLRRLSLLAELQVEETV